MNAYPLSFWEQQSFFKQTDVTVIGSGIVGLMAAIYMKKISPALNVAVIERGALPAGASTRNAGFACFGSMSEILDDLSNTDETTVFDLVVRRFQGLALLREMIGDEKLRYQPLGGYEVFRNQESGLFEQCLANLKYFNQLLEHFTKIKNMYAVANEKIGEFGFSGVKHLIFNRAEGQLDTGEMMRSILRLARETGIQIFNGIEIDRIEENGTLVHLHSTLGWELKTGKVLIATNGFTGKFFPTLELRPARNQVLITKPIKNLPFKGSFHCDMGYVYFRNVDGASDPNQSRVLLGGFRNLSKEAENTSVFGTTEIVQSGLLRFLNETIFPGRKVEIEGWWSGIMGLGDIKKPIVRMVSPRIGLAVRLGGMGVALGSLVGKEAAEMLLQKN